MTVLDAPLDMLIAGRDAEIALGPGLTTTELELTIEGAPVLTLGVIDQPRALLSSGLLDHDENGRLDNRLRIDIDGATYELAGLQKDGDAFTLRAEDVAVAVLRRARGKLRPKSGQNHVEFARRLVKAAGFKFRTPTNQVPKERKGLKAKVERVAADERRDKGIADGAALTVKGAKATSQQRRNMETVLAICARENASPKATLACVLACIVESQFLNLTYGDADSVGILQLRVSLHGAANARSIDKSVTLFLRKGFYGRGSAISIAKAHPDWSPGHVAQETQGSAHPGRYDEWRLEGRKIIDAYDGPSASASSSSSSSAAASSGSSDVSAIRRGTSEAPNESSWDALQRIGKAKGYRCFAVRNVIIYGREQDLIDSRPRLVISEDSPGVDQIDWEWLPGALINTATVQCQAEMWAAPPGSAVKLFDSLGANGRWLVSSFRRSRYSTLATVELRRGTELLKPEAVAESTATTGRAATGSAGSEADSGSGTVRERIVKLAKESMTVNSGFKRYSQAGASNLTTILPKTGRTDCSQWIAAIYHKAGVPSPGTYTGDMVTRGKRTNRPKPGDIMMTASKGHCELYIGGGRMIGHGSPPIDYGNPSNFPGHFFLTYNFLDK